MLPSKLATRIAVLDLAFIYSRSYIDTFTARLKAHLHGKKLTVTTHEWLSV